MEILIYIGVALALLFVANFFLEVGVSLVLSALISAVFLLGMDFELAWSLVNSDVELLEEPLFLASVVASAIALILVWFLEGMNLIVLMVVWALFQLPSYERISGNFESINSVFVSEEEVEQE